MGPDELTRFAMREDEQDDGVLRLALTGELDLQGTNQLNARVQELRSAGVALRLDLSRLEFIDSSGLNALISAAHAARSNGWRLEVDRTVQPQVERVIELVGAVPYIWPSDTGEGSS
jgi:anti-sigma B factor antagonist